MEKLENHIEKFKSGKVKTEWTTLNGEIHGKLKKYLSTGQIIKKIIFDKGVLEKVYDYNNNTEYDKESIINYFEKMSNHAIEKELRAFSSSSFVEIIDIPFFKNEKFFLGKLLFKVWGKHSELWLVFMSINNKKLLKIPVYRNRENPSKYTGKYSEYDFSSTNNWLETFEINTMLSSSGRVYIDTLKVK